MAVTIACQKFWLWRAVDDEGEVLDLLVQPRRDKAAAVKLMRKLLKKQGFAPDVLVTDKLRSYRSAKSEIGLSARHEQGLRKNKGLRIRISRRDGASARCSGSNQLAQPSASCPFTPPSKTPLTSSAISRPVARSASYEKKRSRRGEPPPRPESELDLSILPRPKSVPVTAPCRFLGFGLLTVTADGRSTWWRSQRHGSRGATPNGVRASSRSIVGGRGIPSWGVQLGYHK
jgi:hypothetical protein